MNNAVNHLLPMNYGELHLIEALDSVSSWRAWHTWVRQSVPVVRFGQSSALRLIYPTSGITLVKTESRPE
jgi:hypothetical protein